MDLKLRRLQFVRSFNNRQDNGVSGSVRTGPVPRTVPGYRNAHPAPPRTISPELQNGHPPLRRPDSISSASPRQAIVPFLAPMRVHPALRQTLAPEVWTCAAGFPLLLRRWSFGSRAARHSFSRKARQHRKDAFDVRDRQKGSRHFDRDDASGAAGLGLPQIFAALSKICVLSIGKLVYVFRQGSRLCRGSRDVTVCVWQGV
jgi:hypothetical protein